MKYVDRHGTHSYKWDALDRKFGDPDLLAMWVADMDFEVAPCIREALHEYVDAPLGYFATPKSYYEAVATWEKVEHGYDVQPDWICTTPGIVPALYWAVRTFTNPGDGVIICTPVYYPFMSAVESSEGRKLVKCELKRTGTRYEMDFEAFENAVVQNNVKLHILCNPHNPVGRVWTAEELRTLLDICRKHGVKVVSDEIHQDIINPALGHGNIPAATVGDYDDILITMAAGTKTFNLAAVQNSFVIIPDEKMRKSFTGFLSSLSLDDTVGLGHIAVENAFRYGKEWLTDVLQVIYSNYEYMKEQFAQELPDVKVTDLEGTYLTWLDFGAYFSTQAELENFIQNTCKLAVDYGAWFGSNCHETYIRINLATCEENVVDACDRIITNLKK